MKKILVVDDEEIIIFLAKKMLSKQYEVYSAGSAEEAVGIFDKVALDLVLTDLFMPGMSGLEFAELIKRRFDEDMPIVFMTSDESVENEKKGFEQGGMDFIHKPFKETVVLARLENVFQNVDNIRALKNEVRADAMTGLLNKNYSRIEIGELCRKRHGALLMVDLDNFKPVNDIYGHDTGDRLLIRFADILRSHIRTTDVAGRMGGDEFIAFCQNVSEEDIIREKAEGINSDIVRAAKELMGDGMSIPIGASIGAVFVPDDGTDFDTLYKKADKALYDVKHAGKHGYAVYTEENGATEVAAPEKKSGVSEHKLLLEERNYLNGAYEVNYEDFKVVYRFLKRSIENYQKTVQLVIFNLSGKKSQDKISDSVSEYFLKLLKNTLRRGDVVTKNPSGQYMALLPKAGSLDVKVVVKRIFDKWEISGEYRDFEIGYEADDIGEV